MKRRWKLNRKALLLAAAVTLLLVVLCLTDLGVRMVLGRPFAPLLDLGREDVEEGHVRPDRHGAVEECPSANEVAGPIAQQR